LRFHNQEIGLGIQIDAELVNYLYQCGTAHYPDEFGGLLIGHYADDQQTVVILNTVLPVQYKSTKWSFERGAEGLKEELMKYYAQTPCLFYVGEWHTHPDNPAIPSVIDLQALQEITASPEVNIQHPVLLIIKIDNAGYELGFFVRFRGRLYKYISC